MRASFPLASLPLAAAAALLLLTGCDTTPPERDLAYNYRPGYDEQGLLLRYARDAADPVPEDLDTLADLRPLLRPQTSLILHARDTGPLATARAERVAGALGHTVQLRASDEPGRNETVLMVRTPTIVADACLQDPVRVGRNLWTFDDYSRQRLLPPGCANAVMLLRQAEAGQDTLRGRPLPPGASSPFAQAADRYLRRNNERDDPRRGGRGLDGTTDDTGDAPGGSGGGGGGGSGGGAATTGAAAGTGVGATPSATIPSIVPGTTPASGVPLLAPSTGQAQAPAAR